MGIYKHILYLNISSRAVHWHFLFLWEIYFNEVTFGLLKYLCFSQSLIYRLKKYLIAYSFEKDYSYVNRKYSLCALNIIVRPSLFSWMTASI